MPALLARAYRDYGWKQRRRIEAASVSRVGSRRWVGGCRESSVFLFGEKRRLFLWAYSVALKSNRTPKC